MRYRGGKGGWGLRQSLEELRAMRQMLCYPSPSQLRSLPPPSPPTSLTCPQHLPHNAQVGCHVMLQMLVERTLSPPPPTSLTRPQHLPHNYAQVRHDAVLHMLVEREHVQPDVDVWANPTGSGCRSPHTPLLHTSVCSGGGAG